MREEIERAIREILAVDLKVDLPATGADSSDTPLLGSGIGLDSIDALSLVTALEKRFKIEVDDDDLAVPLFTSIRTLAEYVAQKVVQGSNDES